MENIVLTVIIAAYNAEKTIKRCIESVFKGMDADSVKKTEVIVVDDASADLTSDVVCGIDLSFDSDDSVNPVRLIRLAENGGCVAKTRNVGLRLAKGEYVTYLDADDWYEDGAVEKILGLIDEYAPDIIRFGYKEVYPNGEIKVRGNNFEKRGLVTKAEFKSKIYPRFIGGISLNSVCLAVFKRAVIKGIRFPEEFCTAEDAAFSIEAYTAAENVLTLPDSLYCYYQSGGGLTGTGLSLLKKYKYNFMLVPIMLKKLSEWGMDTFLWRLKTILRPVIITIDKIKRKG